MQLGASNTLWSNKTIGRKPGGLVLGALDERVEEVSREFNPQDVTNTLRVSWLVGRRLLLLHPLLPRASSALARPRAMAFGLLVQDESCCPKSSYSTCS